MFVSMPIIYFFILLIFEDAIDGRSVTDSTQNVHSFIKSSDLIYGDMLLRPQAKTRALTTPRLDGKWPNGIIPYTFKTRICDSERRNCTFKDIPSHNATQQQTILSAMRKIEEATAFNSRPCIQFRPKLPSDTAYISIFDGQYCYARLGYYPNSEGTLSLGSGCMHLGTIIHELMHTLDFHHEHQRPDRDQYIKINWENIEEGAEGNYAIDHNMDIKQGTPYDHNSVTHYGPLAFSKNEKDTYDIKPPGKSDRSPNILSDIDVLSIRKVYQCFNEVPTRPPAIDIPPNAKWAQNGLTVAGGNGHGNGTNQLSYPEGLYVDDDQTVYVADQGNHRIVKWKSGATSGQVVAGGNGRENGPHQLSNPWDVIVDKERDSLIICDRGNRRIVRWPRRNGAIGETIISNIDCIGLTMDENGSLYIVDDQKHEVRRYKSGDTKETVVAGGNGKGNRLDQLDGPSYIFVDRDHSVYVSDMVNNRVMKWEEGAKQGIVVAGGQGQGNSLTQLSYPEGVVVDQLGTVYMADYWNHRIVRWLKGATQGSVIIGGNGLGEQSNQLKYPQGLSFDPQGNLYVTDFGNHRVQKFNIEQTTN